MIRPLATPAAPQAAMMAAADHPAPAMTQDKTTDPSAETMSRTVAEAPLQAPAHNARSASSSRGKVHVVLGRAGQSVAIPVDDLVGQQLVLLRPLRGLMSRMRNVSGVALLSGGDVGVVLSPRALCDGAETAPLQHSA
jgi:chemotaxis protein histidine kinase CheA